MPDQTPEHREAALRIAERIVVVKKTDPVYETAIKCVSRALLSEHAENVRLREALKGILCAGAHAHDGSEAFPCFKCLLVNHVNKALSGSPATEATTKKSLEVQP